MFCFYYAFDKDWKGAALRCGVKRHLADRAGAVWLRRKEIRERIREIEQEFLQEDVREFVVRILRKMAENDPGEWMELLLEEDQDLASLRQQLNFWNVTEIKKGKNDVLEVKFVDRIAVLQKLIEIAEERDRDGLQELCKNLFGDGEEAKKDAF